MTFSKLEQEAVVLNATLGMIDDMVNRAIFVFPGEKIESTNLLPKTSESLRQFAILLRDFLSPVTSKGNDPMPFGLPKPPHGGKPTDNTTLFYISRICDDPRIGKNVEILKNHVSCFKDWLEADCFVPRVWLSSIDIEVDLTITRIDFIRMVGDIGKHNFLRLGGQANKLRKILEGNGINISDSQAYAALPDCEDWFYDHLFSYHASTIAEFLNNIRYAIRLYVKPTAEASYRVMSRIDDYLVHHSFERPPEILNDFAWSQYYSLLDSTRREPCFPRFSVSQSLKASF